MQKSNNYDNFDNYYTKKNSKNKNRGNWGEDIAVKYLEENGYKIIQRNFKYGKYGEIDIIAENNNILVFVEVKTRTNFNFGTAVEQISQNKKSHWKQAAEGYMFINQIVGQECRLDLIAIDTHSKDTHSKNYDDKNCNDKNYNDENYDNKNYKITHIENVM
jgi:putative endonuclease